MAKVDTQVFLTKDYVLIKVPRKWSEKVIKSRGVGSLRGSLRNSFENISSVDLQHKTASLIAK